MPILGGKEGVLYGRRENCDWWPDEFYLNVSRFLHLATFITNGIMKLRTPINKIFWKPTVVARLKNLRTSLDLRKQSFLIIHRGAGCREGGQNRTSWLQEEELIYIV